MPKLFRVGRYIVFFWSDETCEPIHVHICVGNPSPNATKVWITKNGGCIVAHNKSRIPHTDLNELLEVVQSSFFLICGEWKKHFNLNDIRFYA